MMSMMDRRSSLCLTKSPIHSPHFTGDGAYDQAGIYGTVAERHPDADVIVPPRSTAVLSEDGETTRPSAIGTFEASQSKDAWPGRSGPGTIGDLWWRLPSAG